MGPWLNIGKWLQIALSMPISMQGSPNSFGLTPLIQDYHFKHLTILFKMFTPKGIQGCLLQILNKSQVKSSSNLPFHLILDSGNIIFLSSLSLKSIIFSSSCEIEVKSSTSTSWGGGGESCLFYFPTPSQGSCLCGSKDSN